MKAFDDLLEEIHGSGWFQRRLFFCLLLPIFFLMPGAILDQIFVLHISPHWCRPPAGLEPEALGLNLSSWKATLLPMELGPDYRMRPSGCRMYNATPDDVERILDGSLVAAESLQTVECRNLNGWDYDQSEFVSTVVSDNDWVCDKGMRTTDLYTLGTVGLIVGTFFFSAFADFKGRRTAFYFAAAVVIVFQLANIGLSHNYTAYAFCKVIAFMAMMPLFQSPMNITTEISSIKRRTLVIGWSCVVWALGGMYVPLIGWLTARWKWMRAIFVTPLLFVFATYRLVPESPRWLVSSGQLNRAADCLVKIAEVNGVRLDPERLRSRLRLMCDEATSEKHLGYLSLFSHRTLATRTVCVSVLFTASAFVYYQLVINIGNMAGNTFLNMFLLALAEGPGCLAGVFLADKIGRRWTHAGLLAFNTIGFFVLAFIVTVQGLTPLVTTVCMCIKFSISATFVVAYVQAMEVFPTCVRQSGIGLAVLVSQMISIGGPYVIYLGATDLRLPYFVMFLVCLVGTCAATLMPETIGASLPETLEEASNFATNDKFFSFKPKRSAAPTNANDDAGREMQKTGGGGGDSDATREADDDDKEAADGLLRGADGAPKAAANDEEAGAA